MSECATYFMYNLLGIQRGWRVPELLHFEMQQCAQKYDNDEWCFNTDHNE